MPFEVSKFYKTTKPSTSGIGSQTVREASFVPDNDLSETEDTGVDVEDELTLYDQEKRYVDEMFEDLADQIESESSDSDTSESSYGEEHESGDNDGESSDSDRDGPAQKKQAGSKTKQNKKNDVRWRKSIPAEVNSQFNGPPFPDPPVDDLDPRKYFDMFFSSELIETISEQTNLYSVQSSGKSIQTNVNEIEQFLGILTLMGVIKFPSYRMYWSPETRIPSIADAMSINRFENLKRYFHISDNSKMPKQGEAEYDKLYKVRPMLQSLVSKCRSVPPEECHSVDEQMIPTKCRSSLRQYLPKKPHKWGIKVWARCGNSGILYNFEVYTGKQKDDKEFGKVGAVVKRLVEHLPKNLGHKVYFDNLFTSINLIKYLKAEGIWSLGTICCNRLAGADKLLKSKKVLVAEGRGSTDYRVDTNSNLVLVRWLDNGVVQLLSSFVGISGGDPVKRWSGKDKEKIDVPCPEIVHEYNKYMGGVDLCDMLLALYRIKLGTRKWYMHIVYYCIGVSIVNAWLLYRRHCEQKKTVKKNVLPLLKFQVQIANSLLQAGKVGKQGPQSKRGRPSHSPVSDNPVSDNPPKRQRPSVSIPQNDIRYDQVGHFPLFADKQQRCRLCKKGYSRIECAKCHVHLCLVKDRNCFHEFHHKS